jgi:hypothetical protein
MTAHDWALRLSRKQKNVARTVGGVDHLPKMRRSKQFVSRMIASHILSIYKINKGCLHGPNKKKKKRATMHVALIRIMASIRSRARLARIDSDEQQIQYISVWLAQMVTTSRGQFSATSLCPESIALTFLDRPS